MISYSRLRDTAWLSNTSSRWIESCRSKIREHGAVVVGRSIG